MDAICVPNTDFSQCRSPAIRGKRVCKVHGGRSTGPKTQQGRNLCGAAKTLHGGETRGIRAKHQQALAELKLIERMGKGVGLIIGIQLSHLVSDGF